MEGATRAEGGGSGRRRKKKRTAEDEANRLLFMTRKRSHRRRPGHRRRAIDALAPEHFQTPRAGLRRIALSAGGVSPRLALVRVTSRSRVSALRPALHAPRGSPGASLPARARAPRSAAAVTFSFWRHRAGRADDRADGGRGRPLAGADVPPPASVLRRVGAVRLVRALAQGSEGSLRASRRRRPVVRAGAGDRPRARALPRHVPRSRTSRSDAPSPVVPPPPLPGSAA
jgi:hypothetical protein